MEATWLHRTSITALTLLVVLILYTIYRVEYPFIGSHIRVMPADFEAALHKMEGELIGPSKASKTVLFTQVPRKGC